jgi:hypothetical protein
MNVSVDGSPADTTGWCRPPAGPRRWLAVDLLWLSSVIAIGLFFTFDLAATSLRTPFAYSGDALGTAASAQTIIETGWMQETPRLGAPFGQVLYDYPIGGDNAHFLMMKVMSWFTSDWVLLVNGFYLLSFFTAAWSAYLCQRWLRVGRVAAIVTSALFAFTPYHFTRGISHLFLASYFIVPIAVLLAVKASTVTRADATLPWSARARRTTPWLLLCALCGSFGAYYAVFAILALMVASGATSIGVRTWRPLLRAALFSAMIGVVFVANISGSIAFQRSNGVNPNVVARTPIELDIYGLRPIQMITPVPGHWLGPLASISDDLSVGYQSEYSQFLGLVGSAALVWMLGWFLVARLRSSDDERQRDSPRELLAVMTVLFVLIGMTGGLSWTLTLVDFTVIRAWNRLSIMIAFMALCWLGLTAGPLARAWVAGRPGRQRVALATAAVVLVFGLIDQASIDGSRPDPDQWAASFESDQNFFQAVEADIPAGAMMYVLPYRRFPEEAPQLRSGDYDLLKPFLQSQTLRWSYGGIKGREADWQEQLRDLAPEELVEALVAVGFSGVVIDRYGYADDAADLASAIATTIDDDPILSPDGRWFSFDLTAQRARYDSGELDDLSTRLLNTPRVSLGGCSPIEGQESATFQWCGTDVTATVSRSADQEDSFEYRFTVASPAGPGTLTIVAGDVETEVLVGPEPKQVSVPLIQGVDQIELIADTPPVDAPGDPRDLRLRITSPTVSEAGS